MSYFVAKQRCRFGKVERQPRPTCAMTEPINWFATGHDNLTL